MTISLTFPQPTNNSSPKRRERTNSSSERPLEAPTAIIKEGTITMLEHSSLRGTRLGGSAASISEHDLPDELPHINVSIPKDTAPHQPTPSKFTGGLQADANIILSAVSTSTGKQSSRKCLLKGKSWFCFAFPLALTLRFRYLPRIFVASSLE